MDGAVPQALGFSWKNCLTFLKEWIPVNGLKCWTATSLLTMSRTNEIMDLALTLQSLGFHQKKRALIYCIQTFGLSSIKFQTMRRKDLIFLQKNSSLPFPELLWTTMQADSFFGGEVKGKDVRGGELCWGVLDHC